MQKGWIAGLDEIVLPASKGLQKRPWLETRGPPGLKFSSFLNTLRFLKKTDVILLVKRSVGKSTEIVLDFSIVGAEMDGRPGGIIFMHPEEPFVNGPDKSRCLNRIIVVSCFLPAFQLCENRPLLKRPAVEVTDFNENSAQEKNFCCVLILAVIQKCNDPAIN